MHLDEAERAAAMPIVASLVAPHGVLIMSLRHGPVPTGRRMFDVSPEETKTLSAKDGLDCVFERLSGSREDLNKAAGVTWTRLAFRKAGGFIPPPSKPDRAGRIRRFSPAGPRRKRKRPIRATGYRVSSIGGTGAWPSARRCG